MTSIVVLGTGMAGMGAAYQASQAGVSVTLFDKNTYPGGHTASWVTPEGFVFDEGPHISFTQDERLQQLLAENIDGRYETFDVYVNNYWRGHWIKHPAQCNLYGLPTDLVVAVLADFIEAQHREPGPIENYADWLIASYGRTFAETFPMEYGLRYHTTTADNMSTDWLGPRLYRPNLKEVLRGALTPQTDDVHYVSHFRYPSEGGFVSYLKKFFAAHEMRLGHCLERLDPKTRTVYFKNGHAQRYQHIVSSIPLPELIPLVDGVPDDVRAAAGRLACTTCVTVNLGIGRSDLSRACWSYFYDRDFIFTRLSFPHMFSPGNAPPGTGSIQAEIYFSKKYRPLDRTPEACIEPTIADLRRCGLLRPDDRILYRDARLIDYANIIFDLDRSDAVATVHGYLDDIGVHYAGRYGMWGYHWTDESFKSGEQAVQNILGQ